MELLAIFLSLLLIAFFSGIEIAFVSASKLRIELLKEKGSQQAKIISGFNHNPSRFISTMIIGLNISLVLFGSITANVLTPERFPFLPEAEIQLLIVQTVITTFIILLFGEMIPKILFRVNSDATLLLFAYPTRFLFYIPLQPLANVFHGISRWMIKTFVGTELQEGAQTFTTEDLEYLVRETAINEGNGHDETDDLNSEIFEKALYLKDVKVRNCMVPRTEIQAMDVSEGLEELKRKFIETKLSRLIIYDETIDRIRGYVHHFDLLKSLSGIKQNIRPLLVIPESMTAHDLLLQFIRDKRNIAWVVDEYGGTAGIITLEDLMEEIFGEIHDEHDEEELVQKKVADNEYVFSGRLEVDYLNREYELDIPEGEYTTLSGYIISGAEDIPEPGTVLELDHFSIKILRASDKRIELLQITVKQTEP